ncbi:MAG TPA: hypothetical protein VJI97_03225 [Candidatus Nanoarchaeia archaeon]|nr:hypothetical protein [Candidatus Nanoarchaeia archaeon]
MKDKKAGIMEGKLIAIILILIFLAITIGLSIVFKDKMSSIISSLFG